MGDCLAGFTRYGSKRHATELPEWSETEGWAACGVWTETDGDAWDQRHPDACRRCAAEVKRRSAKGEEWSMGERCELLAVDGIVHIVPRRADSSALCGERGPFSVFFSATEKEICDDCYGAYADATGSPAAGPDQALRQFFGGNPPAVYAAGQLRRIA